MGILVFYDGDGRIAGDIAKQDWRQMRRLLPLVFEWLNDRVRHPYQNLPPKLTTSPFKLNAMIRVDSEKKEELNLVDAVEWRRFFGWCEFLSTTDPTHRFYAALIQTLREQSRHPDEVRQA
jgi:hypothetical protein